MTRVLVIDNYDSFVYNLVQYLGQLGADCVVRRNDDVTVEQVLARDVDGPFDAVLVSPGPGTPQDAGLCVALFEALDAAGSNLPTFGVCLGHQAFGAAFGATVGRAPELLHGKTSEVHHTGAGVLSGLPDPFTATRYHSLAVDRATLPDDIEVTGWTDTGVIMAMRHRSLPIEGVQFHPESVLTQAGHLMLANWLAACGDAEALTRAPALVAAAEARRTSAFAL